jgi:LmbE family N-acetylglucosaminyl deacetylase
MDQAELTARVAEVVEARRPHTVLTFPPNGMNGHPDHVTTHRLALDALRACGHDAQRLVYFASDSPYDGEARPGFLRPEEVRAGHLRPTHYVDVGPSIEAKMRAMGQHRTQALSVLGFMSAYARRLLVESFHQAIPALPADGGGSTVLWL